MYTCVQLNGSAKVGEREQMSTLLYPVVRPTGGDDVLLKA